MFPRRLIPLACAVVALAAAGAGVVASLHWQSWDTSALVRMHGNLPLARLAVRDDPSFRLRESRGSTTVPTSMRSRAIPSRPARPTGCSTRLRTTGAILRMGGSRGLRAAEAGPAPSPMRCSRSGCSSSSSREAPRASSRRRWAGHRGAGSSSRSTPVSSSPSTPTRASRSARPCSSSVSLAYVRGRRGWALGLFAALCFVKEPLVLVPLAIGAWELWRTRRSAAPASSRSSLRCSGGPTCASISARSRSARAASGSLRRSGGWERALLDAASQSWNVAVDTAQTRARRPFR